MPKVFDQDKLDAVLLTNHVLVDDTKNAWWSGWINLSEMVAGDTVEVITEVKILSTSSITRYKKKTYRNQQEEPACLLPAVPSDVEFKLTLRQTEGTAKDFEWKVFAD